MTPPAALSKRRKWPLHVLTAVLLVLVVAVFNAIACDRIGSGNAPKQPPGEYLGAARLIEGELCGEGQAACSSAVMVQGVLSAETVDLVAQRAAKSSGPLWVCFNSPGGRREVSLSGPLPANVKTCVADVFADGKRRTAVCNSACAWLWMAGRERALFGENSVGFHRSYVYGHAACTPGNLLKSAESLLLAIYLDWQQYTDRDVAIRSEIRWASMTKGADETHRVDARDAVAAGLQPAAMGNAFFKAAAVKAPHAASNK